MDSSGSAWSIESPYRGARHEAPANECCRENAPAARSMLNFADSESRSQRRGRCPSWAFRCPNVPPNMDACFRNGSAGIAPAQRAWPDCVFKVHRAMKGLRMSRPTPVRANSFMSFGITRSPVQYAWYEKLHHPGQHALPQIHGHQRLTTSQSRRTPRTNPPHYWIQSTIDSSRCPADGWVI